MRQPRAAASMARTGSVDPSRAIYDRLLDLLAEAASLRQPRLAAGRLAQHRRAAAADDDGLRVAEHRRTAERGGKRDQHGQQRLAHRQGRPGDGAPLCSSVCGGCVCTAAGHWARVSSRGRVCAHVEAARALHVHEEGVGRLHQALELVALLLQLLRRVEQVDVTHGNVRLERARERNALSQPTAEGLRTSGAANGRERGHDSRRAAAGDSSPSEHRQQIPASHGQRGRACTWQVLPGPSLLGSAALRRRPRARPGAAWAAPELCSPWLLLRVGVSCDGHVRLGVAP